MTPNFVDLTVVDHPLVADRLSLLRDENTEQPEFRRALQELSSMLIYEATRHLSTEEVDIRTPVAQTKSRRLGQTPFIVSILRAGLGMAEAAYFLLPNAQMGFVGLARDEETHQPRTYLESLPARITGPVLVLDPMLATGGSLARCLELIASRGATDITVACVLAAPEGIAHLQQLEIPLKIVTGSLDDHLNENAYIVPGLGDAGDRQFGWA